MFNSQETCQHQSTMELPEFLKCLQCNAELPKTLSVTVHEEVKNADGLV